MDEQDKRKLKQSLTEVINKWAESVSEDVAVYWGDKTTALMADAAFNVFEGVIEIQDYLQTEGLMKDA